MIIRFYSPLTVKCETPRYVIPGELVSVLDSLPVKCQKYFDDIADYFGEHYLMETHEKNYSVHSVVPMPCIHNAVPYICWLVAVEVKSNPDYKPFDVQQCIMDLRKTLDGQIADGWGEGLEQQHINLQGDVYSVHCSATDRVTWPGIWCDGTTLLPCTDVLYGNAGVRPTMLRHGWLDPEAFDYLCADILRWVQSTDAVRKCVKTVESLIANYKVDAPYIQSTIDWLRKRTDDSDRIKQYTKVYNKMERVRHEGTK